MASSWAEARSTMRWAASTQAVAASRAGGVVKIATTCCASVLRPSGTTKNATVSWATADGTALGGADYAPASGTLTFAPGETSKTITVLVNGDRLGEANETFSVNLSGATNAIIVDGQGVGTITDDEPRISITPSMSRGEGNNGQTPFAFAVTLSSAYDAPATVDWATADGTATAGSDYQAASGTLTIPAGQTTGTITVLVNGDRLGEPNETFFVNLSSPTNATIADGQGIGTILDDEPRISINDVTVTEGNTGAVNATFTVSLSVAYDVAVTVHYQTANGSATAGSDYAAASGDVTIAAGQTTKTFTVAVIGDRSAEPTENFVVNLSAATNGLIVDSQGVGTILDDEPRISISDVTKAEGKKNQTTLFTFTVTLSAAYDQAVTMSFRTVDGTAKTSDSDYIAKTGTLTFAPGETTKTITIEVKGDSKKEANETFYLDLFGNSSNSLFTKNRGLGTILDDDGGALLLTLATDLATASEHPGRR
jgi:chitinase